MSFGIKKYEDLPEATELDDDNLIAASINGVIYSFKISVLYSILTNNFSGSIDEAKTLKNDLTNLKNEIGTEANALTNLINQAEENLNALIALGDATNLATDVSNVKIEVETARKGEVDLNTRLNKFDTSLSDRVKKTSADITYYVNASTGLDANNGLTSGTAFKTIQHVIDNLPQVINHTITIQLATGTYNEDVIIQGFMGTGEVKISGGTDLSSASNYIINSVAITQVKCAVRLFSCSFNSIIKTSIYAWGSSKVTIYYVKLLNSTTTQNGIYAGFSTVYIIGSDISNRNSGMFADFGSTIISSTNTGSGNVIGLYSQYGSTIGKVNTQPSGTTAESTSGGGVIKGDTQYYKTSATRDAQTTGTQTITLPFTPKYVQIKATIYNTKYMSIGDSDGTTTLCLNELNVNANYGSASSIVYMNSGGTDYVNATIAFGNNSIVLTWSKAGTTITGNIFLDITAYN